jgi:hypothetical protein
MTPRRRAVSVRDWRELAPETERVWPTLSAEDLRLVAEVDQRELAYQRARVAPQVAARLAEPTYSVRNRLRAWEVLVRKMETGWPPDGVYYPEEYVNDLTIRDNLEEIVRAFPAGLRLTLSRLLESLDERFRLRTTDDRGAALRPWTRPPGDRDRNWWWYRAPPGLSWAGG